MRLLSLENELRLECERLAREWSASRAGDPGTPLVINVLVSGGKDSMALLHATSRVWRSAHFQLRDDVQVQALHFDHHTRNGASTHDAEFVSQECLSLGIPVLHFAWNVPPLAPGDQDLSKGQNSQTFQSQASHWRRETCQHLRRLHGPHWIFFTAHHAGDHAETILMNLIRGCGRQGLLGFLNPHPPDGMHKPFGQLSTADLSAYLAARNIRYREDATNRERCYTRNTVRHEILTAMRKINPRIEETLLQMSAHLAAESRTQAPDIATEPKPMSWTPTEILELIRTQYPGYTRLITASQLENLAHHAEIAAQPPRGRTRAAPFTLPLSHGWSAVISSSGLILLQPGSHLPR